MADTESLKSFLVDIGFSVDADQERRLQEALANLEKNVNRFSQSIDQATKSLEKFFGYFQKSEGPMRQHTETTTRLNKSFVEFEKSLKRVAEMVVAGLLTKAFFDLNSQLEKLHYTAMAAGTTVRNLMSAQFAGPQAGASVDAITNSLVGLRQALSTPGTAQVISQMLNIPLDRIIDPMTHKLRDMTDVMKIVLPALSNLYQQGEVGVAIAKRISETANIDWQGLQLLIANPAQTQAYLEWQKRFDAIADRMGLSQQKLKETSDQATNLGQQFREVIATLELLAIKLVAPWIGPVTDAMKWIENELISLNDELDKLSRETGGVSDKVVGLGAAFLGAVGGVKALGVALRFVLSPLRAIATVGAGVTGILSGIAGLATGILSKVGGLAIRSAPVLGPAAAMIMDPRPLNLGEPQLKGPTGPGAMAPKDWAGVWQAIKERFGYGGTMPVTPPGVTQLPDVNVQASHYQHGGIVPRTGPAVLHAGEGVVTADAMSGLARLGPTMEDLWDGFRNWWFGGGNYRPNVVVSNIDELTQGLQEFPEDETGGGYPGNAGGGGPRGRFAIGAPRTPLPATGGGAANAGNIEQLGDPRSPGWGASNLTTVTSPSGKTFRVNKWAAPAFSGFLAALEATGYVINQQESGGYNLRNIRGSSRLSQHAFGTAIDINAEENPMGGTTSNLPADISAIAARFGLNWGGNWRTRKDPMHFEWGGGNYTQSVMDSAPLGTTNNYRAGDKTVTLNAQANFNITGSEALREGGALNSAASRTNADLIRNLSPIVQ